MIVSLWRQLFYERQKEIGKIVDDEDEESKENKLNRYNIILLKLTPKEIKRWKRDKHERADFIKKVKNSKKYYAKFFVAKTRLDRFWKKWNRKYRALNSVPSENGEYLNRQNLETNVDNKIEKNDSTLLKLIQIHQKARKFYVKQYLLLNKDLQVFENIDSKSLEKIDRNYQNYEKSSVAKRQAIRETRRWELFVATIVGALIPTILDLLPKIYNLILEFLTSKRKNLKAEPQKAPPTNPRSHNPSREE